MPSLHALSKLISSVDDNLNLEIPGLQLTDAAEYDQHYTIDGTVGGKVFFTFITDIDDWVANEYKAELQEKFGDDIVKKDDTWNVFHFNPEHEKIEEAVDYMLEKHPEIFTDVIPKLLTDASARRKYDTNVYSLFVDWIGKQEEGGRDYLYSQNNGDPDDITFTVLAQKFVAPQPEEPDKPESHSDAWVELPDPITPAPTIKPIEPTETHIAYITGHPEGTVMANGNVTRAEAAAMVTRLAGLDLTNENRPDFSDVTSSWYVKYINAALKANMLDSADGKIRPNEKITRAEFAKMLAAIDKDNDFVSSFADVKGHKYENEINKISGNKRILGYEDGSFRPDGLLTRAEAAAMLNRMFNRVADSIAVAGHENELVKFSDLNGTEWYYYEIVEAANTHELIRRGTSDNLDRLHETWIRVLITTVK